MQKLYLYLGIFRKLYNPQTNSVTNYELPVEGGKEENVPYMIFSYFPLLVSPLLPCFVFIHCGL